MIAMAIISTVFMMCSIFGSWLNLRDRQTHWNTLMYVGFYGGVTCLLVLSFFGRF